MCEQTIEEKVGDKTDDRRSTIRLCRWAVVVRCRGGLPCPDKATGDRRQATRRQDRQLEATSKWSSGSRLLPEATIAITPPTPPTPPHTTHTTHNTTHQAGPEKATAQTELALQRSSVCIEPMAWLPRPRHTCSPTRSQSRMHDIQPAGQMRQCNARGLIQPVLAVQEHLIR